MGLVVDLFGGCSITVSVGGIFSYSRLAFSQSLWSIGDLLDIHSLAVLVTFVIIGRVFTFSAISCGCIWCTPLFNSLYRGIYCYSRRYFAVFLRSGFIEWYTFFYSLRWFSATMGSVSTFSGFSCGFIWWMLYSSLRRGNFCYGQWVFSQPLWSRSDLFDWYTFSRRFGWFLLQLGELPQ